MGVYVTQDWKLDKGKMVSNIPFNLMHTSLMRMKQKDQLKK